MIDWLIITVSHRGSKPRTEHSNNNDRCLLWMRHGCSSAIPVLAKVDSALICPLLSTHYTQFCQMLVQVAQLMTRFLLLPWWLGRSEWGLICPEILDKLTSEHTWNCVWLNESWKHVVWFRQHKLLVKIRERSGLKWRLNAHKCCLPTYISNSKILYMQPPPLCVYPYWTSVGVLRLGPLSKFLLPSLGLHISVPHVCIIVSCCSNIQSTTHLCLSGVKKMHCRSCFHWKESESEFKGGIKCLTLHDDNQLHDTNYSGTPM